MYLDSLPNYFPGKFVSTCGTVHAANMVTSTLTYTVCTLLYALSYGETVLGEQVYKGVSQQAVVSSKVSISVYVELTDLFPQLYVLTPFM